MHLTLILNSTSLSTMFRHDEKEQTCAFVRGIVWLDYCAVFRCEFIMWFILILLSELSLVVYNKSLRYPA